MRISSGTPLVLLAAAAAVIAGEGAWAASEDLGNGFLHHGVATPIWDHRGVVATVDGQGHNVVLLWLYDHRGGYALLLIDTQTGTSKEYPMPFPPGGDCPFASILSSRNRFYTHYNGYFVEFDAQTRAFTFHHETKPRMAMSMTEDDAGVIWAFTYPSCGVVSFDPKTRELRDYGHVHDENWAQYPRYAAADDAGWVYFGLGSTSGQIFIFDRRTGKATPVVPQEERVQGMGQVYRDVNGKVYGHPGGEGDKWYELYKGEAKKLSKSPGVKHKPIITGSQGLFHTTFPDGKALKSCDFVERVTIVEDPATGTTKEIKFDYTSEGAHVMGLAAAPDGTICGGTAFPMRFFSFDPKRDAWTNRLCYSQWNTVAVQGDRFFVGGYPSGFLLEWDPSKPWAETQKDNPASNPRFLMECHPTINRPHDLLTCPDGRTIVLAGTPGYGYTGGGLLIWDRETKSGTLLEHTDLLPEQSTLSLAALSDGKVLGGSTTAAGTGGEQKAKQAELYVLDLASKKIEWHQAVFPGVQGYTDLCPGPRGLVYGVADQRRFFVFDPSERKVVHEQDTSETLGNTVSHQGPRVFVRGPEGAVYMLFAKGIARVDPKTFKIELLAESPVPINLGGDCLDGRIYFGHESHVYSYKVPDS